MRRYVRFGIPARLAVGILVIGGIAIILAMSWHSRRKPPGPLRGAEEEEVLLGHTAPVTSVAFSPAGTMLVSGSEDQTARLWSLATGQERETFRGHVGPVLSVTFAHDGELIASGSADGTIK